jgi:signal recognition particle subunit SRP54
MDALEDFHPDRIANRILGMGDIVSLVEKAAQTIDVQKAQKIAEKMRKGKFDLEDLADQLAQVEKIGGLGGIMGMLPGIAKMKDQLASAQLDDRVVKRQRAIILSMTARERRNPDILKASRKKRIAAGSGTRVEDVNRLLKQHRQMADMMKQLGSAKRGPLSQMASAFGLGGGMPMPNPEELAALQKQMGQGAGATPKLPEMPAGLFGKSPKLPSGLPGLGGGKLPGLGGGFNPFEKKK